MRTETATTFKHSMQEWGGRPQKKDSQKPQTAWSVTLILLAVMTIKNLLVLTKHLQC
jgi:hypothetical protein